MMAMAMQFLLSILLASHLLVVNLAMTGPLCCIWLEHRAGRTQQPDLRMIAVRLARWSLASLMLVVASGGALLGLMWLAGDLRLFDAAKLVPVRITHAAWEILFSCVCLTVYVIWFGQQKKTRFLGRCLQRLLAILAATNLMYHFPPLFTILWQLQRNSALGNEPVSQDAFRQMLLSAEVWAATIHYWLAAITTSAVAVMILASRSLQTRKTDGETVSYRITISAGRLALLATVLQIPVGFWLLSTMPANQQEKLLGTDWVATFLLMSALVATWFLLQQLASICWGDFECPPVWRTTGWLCCVITLMCGALISSRNSKQAQNHHLPGPSKPATASDGHRMEPDTTANVP